MTSAFNEFKGIAIINTLRSCQLFTGLPSADLESIAAITVVKALDKDAYLFHGAMRRKGFTSCNAGR